MKRTPNLYEPNGYLNAKTILDLPYPFIFIVGGRGIGKTYGVLREYMRRGEKILLLRRTQQQADIVAKQDFSPYRPIMRDEDKLYTSRGITKLNSAVYYADEEGAIADHNPICLTGALSTLSSIRGIGGDDIKAIVYDEFIPEPHEHQMKNEGEALMNAYETIARNREMQGEKPLKLICMANAFRLGNPIFEYLGVVKQAEKAWRSRKEWYVNEKKGMCIIFPNADTIAEQKSKTVLYQLTYGSKFAEFALGNQFGDDFSDNIKSQNLREYLPYIELADGMIYIHKSENVYYVSSHKSGTAPDVYGNGNMDKRRLLDKHAYLYRANLNHRVMFEDYPAQLMFDKLFVK